MEAQDDIFTDNLTLDDCDLQTKSGRKRGLEKIAKWAMSKPMERIKAIEVIGKIEGDFIVKTEVRHSGQIDTAKTLDDFYQENGKP